MGIWNRLARHEAKHGQARIAVIGAGYVATGVVHTLNTSVGMRPALIVNRDVERAISAFQELGYDRSQVVISSKTSDLANAITAGIPAITDSYEHLSSLPLDVVVEATGALDYGANVILTALDAGIHVVSFNAEVDVLLAWLFNNRAREANVIYTIADGDQPGALLRLSEQVEGMGFEVGAMINCKRHMDIYQNPSSGSQYASRDTTSSHMTTAFGDGTKMQVEQAVVANATGMIPVKRGMHGIDTCLANAASTISQKLNLHTRSDYADGYVDFTLGGDFAAGVGVIATHPEGAHHKKALNLYKMGDGPNYFFFRPYHLVHLELPLTIAEILLDREPLATVCEPHVAEVLAIAKKPLATGEQLDGIGGYTCYGLIDTRERAEGYLPIGLIDYATMNADHPRDMPIPLDNVALDTSKLVVREWLKLNEQWSTSNQFASNSFQTASAAMLHQ